MKKIKYYSCPRCNWYGKENETFREQWSDIYGWYYIRCPKCSTQLNEQGKGDV